MSLALAKKNGGGFSTASAEDIYVDDDTQLSALLASIQTQLNALSAFLSQMAQLIPSLAFTASGHNGAAAVSAANAAITAMGGTVISTYAITKALTNCAISNAAAGITEGGSYSAAITAFSGYTLGTVTVTMGGTDITSTAYSNGAVSIASVTGDIVITASASPITYTVTNSLANCTNSNGAASVNYGSSYSATIAAASGYTLQSVTVTMGGTDITGTAYNSGTGAISIAFVTGNVAITATAASYTLFSISATFNQGGNTVYESASLDDLKQYLTVTATYSDSSTETVSASSYTLSGALAAGTSTITVSYGGMTDTFTVTVTAAQADLSSISAALNLNGAIIRTSNSLNDLKQYLTVTAAYSNSTTAAVSGNDYTLSGSLALDSGSYDASTKTVTVSYGGKTATVQVKVYNAMTAAKATLPSGYTQLAMVTSAGSTACYVDTGIASSAVDHVEYGVQAVSGIGNGTNWHVLSSADTWYPYFRQGSSGARNFQGKNRNSGSSATSIDTTWEADTNYVIEAYPDVKINGTTAATIASSNASDSANLFVFARNSSGSPQNAGKVRMYYIKMYDGQDQLIHNYVPCKNSSNVAGLYDTVGAAFYSSAGGTALTAGEAL